MTFLMSCKGGHNFFDELKGRLSGFVCLFACFLDFVFVFCFCFVKAVFCA